jgi:hypothetical protein
VSVFVQKRDIMEKNSNRGNVGIVYFFKGGLGKNQEVSSLLVLCQKNKATNLQEV